MSSRNQVAAHHQLVDQMLDVTDIGRQRAGTGVTSTVTTRQQPQDNLYNDHLTLNGSQPATNSFTPPQVPQVRSWTNISTTPAALVAATAQGDNQITINNGNYEEGHRHSTGAGTTANNPNHRVVRFKSLMAPAAVINESDEISQQSKIDIRGQELIDLASLPAPTSGVIENNINKNKKKQQQTNRPNRQNQTATFPSEKDRAGDSEGDDDDEGTHRDESSNFFDDYENPENLTDDDDGQDYDLTGDDSEITTNGPCASPSHHKFKSRNTTSYVLRLYRQVTCLGSNIKSKLTGADTYRAGNSFAYTAYEQDSATGQLAKVSGVKKYRLARTAKRKSPEQNFRGPYRYSRIGIVMTIFKKLLSFLVQRSTLALFGAFLIHVTLGTIYTLSNINSYLTSYMRKHGTPNATYGGSMWISSSYAVGQGLSMILGGVIEKRFSARLSCIIGCALHSLSVMSTSRSVDYGQLAVLLTYGFLPGFGCGLSYMTPMSNGFGWFPNRKGLVAGTILAGFGIGTFVFNMAQTAYVNPNNLSPPANADGYFTQEEILNNVPHLFTFLGTIYACMQFIGCCLLFKPPQTSMGEAGYIKGSVPQDERPILMDSEMSFKKAIRTREFIVLFLVFGITNQGVLFVNAMLKEYGQMFIADDLYLAWTGSMASIANSMGRLVWGLAIDRYSFAFCFTSITTIFGLLMFLMPFEFILSSKLLYLMCTLGIFGSFSGWMSTYPVHLSRIFGVKNSGMIYGLIFVSQSIGGIVTAFGAHYLIDHYSRFVPFFCVASLEVLGLSIYHLFYNK